MAAPTTDTSDRQPFAIADVRIWDGVSERAGAQRLHLRVEGGRIAAIGADSSLLAHAQVWRAPEGATAVPGLIDAHVHVTLDPGVASIPEQLAIAPDAVARQSALRAHQMAAAGITTARDLGGGAGLEIQLRDRIDRGELPGPRLLCAGQPLTPPGGHCHFWGGVVGDGDSIEQVIDRQVERGADWIKVMATGGVNTKGTSVRDAQFDAETLTRIRELAASTGRSVAAHCHGTAGIRNAALARVASIEHCSFAGEKGFGSDFDPALPQAIRAAGTWVSPTVNAGWQRFIERDGKPTRFFEAAREYLAALAGAGVPLIASTDAGIPNVVHRDLPVALQVFARFTDGSPSEVLQSATVRSANALGLRDETGELRAGLSADVLITDGDPTAGLSALESPLLVLARGRRIQPPPN